MEVSQSPNWGCSAKGGADVEEIRGGLRKICHEEFHNLYPSPNIVMAMKRGVHVTQNGKLRLYSIFGSRTRRK
jgi:hypothetical protein